ncbi:MAG: flavodoxin family protein [Ruminiclostridium sp.]|nr:flavodoxin family protein [Ruminiclostridium sp.]
MKALIISDSEYRTETFERLEGLVHKYLLQKGFDIEDVRIEKDELGYCMGCFGCWVKKPGECVINDRMGSINRSFINSDVAFYLSPIVFGQYSCNIKTVLDRWLPNILPFFITRKDGSTMHPARYKEYPFPIMIGYANDLSEEDKKLFTDINKHRSNVGVLFYQDNDMEIIKALDQISLKKQGDEM